MSWLFPPQFVFSKSILAYCRQQFYLQQLFNFDIIFVYQTSKSHGYCQPLNKIHGADFLLVQDLPLKILANSDCIQLYILNYINSIENHLLINNTSKMIRVNISHTYICFFNLYNVQKFKIYYHLDLNIKLSSPVQRRNSLKCLVQPSEFCHRLFRKDVI